MRRSKREDLRRIKPRWVRENKIGRAYTDLRDRILGREIPVGEILKFKDLKTKYKTDPGEIQPILIRLAMEGLIKVLPARGEKKPAHAALSMYMVADPDVRTRMLSTRHGDFVADVSDANGENTAFKETVTLTVVAADEEVAKYLGISVGERVVYHRTIQYRDKDTPVCVCDHYIGLWFVEMMPELASPDSDAYALMERLGKEPAWYTETDDSDNVDVIEREMLDLAVDDPTSVFKMIKQVYNMDGSALDVGWLTNRGDMYRLKYSAPFRREMIPEQFRDK